MITIRHRTKDEKDDCPWPQADFTGHWIVEWPNGMPKVRVTYKNGIEEGAFFCYWQDGKIAQEGVYEGGVCIGIWKDYTPDGIRFKESHYRDSKNFDVLWFDPSGQHYSTQVFVDGVEQKRRKRK